jgi:tRNA (cytidine/uridine-2'-O-)-methyltransferase
MPTISSGRFAVKKDETEDLQSEDPGDGNCFPGSEPALRVVLYQPEIPQNTGNIARTCAATHTPLHLIEPLGFRLSDRYLKRAGLDYWPRVSLKVHASFEELREDLGPARMVYFSTHASRPYHAFQFLPGDCLVFGSETAGLPREMLDSEACEILKIPIDRSRVRSLNLATSVGIALFEALRQLAMRRQEHVFSCSSGLGDSSELEGSASGFFSR